MGDYSTLNTKLNHMISEIESLKKENSRLNQIVKSTNSAITSLTQSSSTFRATGNQEAFQKSNQLSLDVNNTISLTERNTEDINSYSLQKFANTNKYKRTSEYRSPCKRAAMSDKDIIVKLMTTLNVYTTENLVQVISNLSKQSKFNAASSKLVAKINKLYYSLYGKGVNIKDIWDWIKGLVKKMGECHAKMMEQEQTILEYDMQLKGFSEELNKQNQYKLLCEDLMTKLKITDFQVFKDEIYGLALKSKPAQQLTIAEGPRDRENSRRTSVKSDNENPLPRPVQETAGKLNTKAFKKTN